MRTEILAALERHLAAAAARRTTIATYRRIAKAFLAHVAPTALPLVTSKQVEAFIGRARRSGAARAVATRNLDVVALRALFRAADVPDPTTGIRLKRAERREPAVPSSSELRELFEAASRRPDATRVLAMLALLFQCGLRVSELVALRVSQVDLGERSLLSVAGKNGTLTSLPLGPETVLLLARLLVERPGGRRWLFVGRGGRGALSARTVQRVVGELRDDAGLAKRVTPHSLRHATATQAILRGVDLPTTASLMRHARVETTMGYVELASDARRGAAERIGLAIPREVLGGVANGGDTLPVDGEDELHDIA